MSIPGAASPLFLATTAGGAAGAFEISRSLRFNSGDSAYLNRDVSSASNRKTWTWSGWVKKSVTGNVVSLFGVGTNSTNLDAIDYQDESLRYTRSTGGSFLSLKTNAVFRDPSAWYHVVVAVDTTQATAANRVKIYVNGTQETSFSSSSYPSQNEDTFVNSTNNHTIGRRNIHQSDYFDGYIAETALVDGSQLDPTSFGAFDDNGMWQAIDTAGLTFGTNGFRLKFADNSGSTATTLGKDTSGNSNNWTPNNLSAGAVSNPTAKQNFDVVTYTGNGAARSISSFSFKPDLVWIKQRSGTQWHYLIDSVRGNTKAVFSNATNSEYTTSAQVLTAFNNDGFSLGTDTAVNANSSTYVAWCWKANGAAVSNTDGTITSSVSANQAHGFSIATFTSPSSGNFTFGTGLNAVPKVIFVKTTGATSDWSVYHASVTDSTSKYLVLNSTAAVGTYSTIWGAALPTSTVVGLTSGGAVATSQTCVAYCWSEVAGFSKFGSYTGNGSSTGPTVTTGFKPTYVLIKRTDSSGYHWAIIDAKRGTNKELLANLSAAEGSTLSVSFTSTGFQITNTAPDINGSGGTFIYAAFAATVDESAVSDCFVDTPTNAATPSDSGVGNEVVGNYATLNPLAQFGSNNQTGTLSNGNLDWTTSSTNYFANAVSTIAAKTGKYYVETVCQNASNSGIGFVNAASTNSITGNYGLGAPSDGWLRQHTVVNNNNSNAVTGMATLAVGDIIGLALDLDNGKAWWSKNGVFHNSGNPANGTNATVTFTPGNKDWLIGITLVSPSAPQSINFGQRAFSYPVSGYKALCTANLPTPTIADGSKYFDTKLYTGNGGNNPQTGLGFSPDFVWLKNRSHTDGWHQLRDIVRGGDKNLASNATNVETDASNKDLDFNSNGFTLTGTSGSRDDNKSGDAYVAWAWDGGTSTVTNNDGSIASSVRANPSAGFSIVTYSGNSVSGATIGHGLNAEPEFLIVKARTKADDWRVYSKAAGQGNYLRLQGTNPVTSGGNWQSISSTTFGLDSDSAVNSSSYTYVAYCFAPVNSYSAMGAYTGNGSSDGPFIHTGFKIAWLLTKRTDGGSNNWQLIDSTRSPFNVADDILKPDESAAESSHADYSVDFLSNGFKHRTGHVARNGSGNTYIYIAFAENPFQANGGLAR